jgi:hypothetical protein
MSAVPEHFMRPEGRRMHERRRARKRRRPARDADTPMQKFWLWFAIGALLFCWIAEATMCAERGF